MRLRSLSCRLIVYAIIGSILGYLILPLAFMIGMLVLVRPGGIDALDELLRPRVREIMLAALRKDAGGERSLAMTDALRDFISEHPDFRFGAFDPRTGAAFSGSSPEIVERFEGVGRLKLSRSSIAVIVDGASRRGESYVLDSPVGDVVVATGGLRFGWRDLFRLPVYTVSFPGAMFLLPHWAAMCLIALFVVNRGLAPMRAAAAKIATIDVNSLKERIAPDEAPSEMRPFVEAVNKAFERVREGVERQRRFSANSAHELRTPITILRARVGKMEEGALKAEIERDVLRVQTIVEQMLLLAQIRERGPIAPQRIDLHDIVLGVAADLVPIALGDGRDIQFEAPSRHVIALALRWSVESIVANLIANAVRAEPRGGAVVVRVLPDCVIEVVDHGSGVAEADRGRIFEPFWRKDETTPGTGLGLSIVRELVELQGGALSVAETPGGGATFRVRLPAAGAEPEPAERAVQPSLDQRCERSA
ncbi:sensor histidine kinase [Methylosinus sp. LW4]|uniref:sensor histidine kinase n=1 Tax=Methylosinus sp. LW4 TaxID=136993 RepID=UPI000685F6E3|nr:HAMP domain-containing sensor histidine kinase [Methylosinus sp. LW4]